MAITKTNERQRVKKAFDFYRKRLSIKGDVTLTIKDTGINDEDKVMVNVKRHNGKLIFDVIVKVHKLFGLDDRITSLAHEMVHIDQITSGRLDPFEKTWDGKPVSTTNYWHLPWESDARVRAYDLWVEFNRAMRDKLTEELNPEEVKKLDYEVKSLENSLKSEYKDAIKDLHLFLKTNGAIHIGAIRINLEYRQQGIGAAIMRKIAEFADKHHLYITLSPEPERGYKDKLDRFYKALGYIANKGRNRDSRLSSPFEKTLLRKPKG